MESFKKIIESDGGTTTDFMLVHNNLKTIKEEMKNLFDEIVSSIYSYHDQMEGSDTSILTKKNYELKDNYHNENEFSSEEEVDNNIINNEQINSNDVNNNANIVQENNVQNVVTIEKKPTIKDKNSQYYFLSDNIEDIHDDNYKYKNLQINHIKLFVLKNSLRNYDKLYKKLASPVYFNEPISMGQKQCEKFKYIDLLIKEPSKEKQMCYIAAFVIGEIFLNLGRSLKPFSPIIGETYEYFDNSKNFRFYSEHVCHNPQTNA